MSIIDSVVLFKSQNKIKEIEKQNLKEMDGGQPKEMQEQEKIDQS